MPLEGCTKCWARRTNFEKTFLVFGLLMLLAFVLLLVLGSTISGCNYTSSNKICQSKSCLETAARVISMANSEIDPCHDFYEFACGGYIKTHASSANQEDVSVEQEASDTVLRNIKNWLETISSTDVPVNQNMGNAFKSCMNYASSPMTPKVILMKAFLEYELTEWPILNDYWAESNGDLEKSLAALGLLGIPAVFQLDVVPDDKYPGRFIIKLSPGKPMFSDEEEKELTGEFLLHFMESALMMFGVPKSRAQSYVEDIRQMEAYVLKSSQNAMKECGDNRSEDLSGLRLDSFYKIEEYMSSSEPNWANVFSNMLLEMTYRSEDHFPVNLYCRRHIRNFNEFPKPFFTYVGWRVLFSTLPHIGPRFHWLYEDYKHHFNESMLALPRWKECVHLLEKYMQPVLATMYLKQAVTNDILIEKVRIADSIRSTFIERISSAKWLSDEKKREITQKILMSKFEMPTLKPNPDIKKLDSYYKELYITDDHVSLNVLRLKKFMVLKDIDKVFKPNESYYDWSNLTLTSANRKDDGFKGNRITLYFDKLIPPYLNPKLPSHMNYGAFGTVLAKELNRYIGSFNMSHLGFSESVWEAFLQSDKGNECINAKTDIEPETILDYRRENWIDAFMEMDAIKTSYKAYMEQAEPDEDELIGLTMPRNQVFFISYAQSMCESRDALLKNNRTKLDSRNLVNYALQNMEEFQDAFSCVKANPMVADKMCKVWN